MHAHLHPGPVLVNNRLAILLYSDPYDDNPDSIISFAPAMAAPAHHDDWYLALEGQFGIGNPDRFDLFAVEVSPFNGLEVRIREIESGNHDTMHSFRNMIAMTFSTRLMAAGGAIADHGNAVLSLAQRGTEHMCGSLNNDDVAQNSPYHFLILNRAAPIGQPPQRIFFNLSTLRSQVANINGNNIDAYTHHKLVKALFYAIHGGSLLV
eukprot:TRINITY_DN12331_c0_g1_i1.p1 TRINITY_DN12331_c0_g1~~TRINITY_DN12331_c0_g1_i1.p1  ORF type:complete len:208 (-),score=15.82 TRINITY_DN12331_c0_g1_i1:236-859(-)